MQDGGFERFLEGLPLKFRVMDISLGVDTQMEFLEMLGKVDESFSHDFFKKNEARLFSPDTPFAELKQLLVHLSMVDSVEAMRSLERYVEQCPGEVKEFAQMAAYQSKLFLEASILGENQVLVASGMGGEGERMRFFVALMSRNRAPLSGAQQQLVQKEVEYQLKQSGATVESVTFEGGYVRIFALIPMRTNVKRLLERCIAECNELGSFMDQNMIISTVKPLSVDELDRIVNERSADER